MLKHSDLTSQVINSFYKVYNALGYGFLEKVYENSLLIEFKNQGLKADAQRAIDVRYDNQIVGRYFADLIIEDKVIIEIKAIENLDERHGFQLINYLKATNIEVGLLLNFGHLPSFQRKIFSNH